MKVKLIAVLIAIAALFISAVLWRTDSFVYGDRMSWVEAQARTQMGSLSHSLNSELKSLQRLVLDLRVEELGKTSNKWNSLNPYFAVASFTFNNDKLQQNFYAAKEGSAAEKWSADFVKAALGNISSSSRSGVKFFIKPFQDSQRHNYIAMLFLEQNRALAIFGTGDNFQAFIDSQKGSINSFSIATTTGLTVAHSIPEYVGTSISQDVVFQEATKSGASYGNAVLEINKKQKVFGVYEVVPQTNLLVLSAAPLEQAMQGREGLWMQFLLLGLGIIAVGAAGALWVIKPAEKRIEDLEQEVAEASSKVAPPSGVQNPEVTLAADPATANQAKLEAATQVSSALAHEMRGPLASILGYTQMIVANTEDEEVKKNTDSILRETRAARSVIEKLLGYAGEEIHEKVILRIDAPLSKALKEMENTFSNKGIKINSELESNEPIPLDVETLTKAMVNILQNSVEAMERMQNKEITIKTFDDEKGLHLEISDTGEGIDASNVNKIFDPFYTTRSFQNHMGLGLSAAYGVLKEHGADVQVESQRGDGTKISILFKLDPNKERISDLPKPPPAPKTKKTLPPPAPAEELVAIKPPPSAEEIVAAKLPPPVEELVAAIPVPPVVAKPPPPPPVKMPPPPPDEKFDDSDEATIVFDSSEGSPLDVNIENLLEELPEVDSNPAIVVPPVVEKVIKKVKKKKTFGEDELTFIDGFLESDDEEEVEVEVEQEVVVDVNDFEMQEPGQPLETPLAAREEPAMTQEVPEMKADFVSAQKILPPSKKRDKKVSQLDSYKVDIRKPGKRD